MRCEACGRPYDGEALLPREIACQGCHLEYVVLLAELDDKGLERYTAAQALAMARQKHYAREKADGDAEILRRYEANAAGLHAATGAPLALSGQALDDVKAAAAKVVATLKR